MLRNTRSSRPVAVLRHRAAHLRSAASAALLTLGCLLPALLLAQSTPELLRSYRGSGGLGWAIADMADLDGDGRRDFVAGANAGGSVVAYSSARLAPLWTATPGLPGFGWSLSSAGDIDGDGLADVIAGAPAATGAGAVRVLSGSNGAVLRSPTRPVGALRFGSAVSSMEDLNGDGMRELLVGSPGGSGRVDVLSGLDGSVLRTHLGSAGSEFGAGLAAVGDLDGDNIADYVVGAPGEGAGRAHVYSGASGVLLHSLSAQSSGRFGEFFVADAGDVDADGTTDVYVGAYAETGNNGAAYVFSGRTGARLHRIAGAFAEGLGPGRSAGDVNGDGHADLIVGGYTFGTADISQGGRATVYSGADLSVLLRINGTRAGGQFGFDAVGIGDVNADGRLDFIVASSPANAVDLFAGSVERPLLPANASGNHSYTYWQPSEPGWGFNVLQQGELVFVTWYTYAPDGQVMFLTVQAELQTDGSYSGPIFRIAGTPFAQIDNAQAFTSATEVGQAQLRFADNGNLTLDYSLTGESSGAPSGETQRKQLQRFTFASSAPSCFGSALSRAALSNYSDLWWNSRESGWGLTLAHQGDSIFALWFTYGAGGRDQWLSASNLSRQADGSFSGSLQRPVSGVPQSQINGPATGFPVPQVGTARLRFSDGDHGIFEYSVDGVNQRKAIRRFVAVAGTAAKPHCVAPPQSVPAPSPAPTVSTEFITTSLLHNSSPVRLEMVVHKPAGHGPFPVVLFNHGSTGTGNNPALFGQTWTHPAAARVFTDRGWMVVFPQRRGRGKSDGVYAEGLAANGSGYTCEASVSLAGMERALTDIDQVVLHLRGRADVDASRMLIAGQSRGGILSIVHAGTRPGNFLGAINLVGGWMSDQCPNPAILNTASFAKGGAYAGPTLWLYGEGDPFYAMAHSRSNFAAFQAAGGQGQFHALNLGPGSNGHALISRPDLWSPLALEFLSDLSSPAPRIDHPTTVATGP